MKELVFITLLFMFPDLSLQAKDYCKLTQQHSLCKSSIFGPSCKNPREVIASEEDKKAILDWHNFIREKVASGQETGSKDGTLPSSSNMRKLTWDDELAEIAQAWANNCIFEHHDCDECRAVLNERFSSVGQNLAYFGSTVNASSINFVSLIDGWYTKEVENFQQSLISSFQSLTGGIYGHYTQVIWAETEAIGCGGVIYEDKIYTNQLVVCNYAESGNFLSLPVYEIGIPCSTCLSATSCDGSLCGEDGNRFQGVSMNSGANVLSFLHLPM